MQTQTIQSGKRIGNESFDSIPAETKVRCLRDHIVFEPIPWPFSDIIEVIYTGRPCRGKVKAVGPGDYPLRYNGPKGKRTKSWSSLQFRPTDVKVGDIIQIGGLSIDGYLFTSFRWGSVQHVVCREQDVTCVEEGEFRVHPTLAHAREMERMFGRVEA